LILQVAVNNLNDNIVFIFDLGAAGDGSANSTYYFDDITISSCSSFTAPTLPLDFRSTTTAYTFVDFDPENVLQLVGLSCTGGTVGSEMVELAEVLK
jgi:hypothetical protein